MVDGRKARERGRVKEREREMCAFVCAFDSPMNQASEMEKSRSPFLEGHSFSLSFEKPCTLKHKMEPHMLWLSGRLHYRCTRYSSWLSEWNWADTDEKCALSSVHEKKSEKIHSGKTTKMWIKKIYRAHKPKLSNRKPAKLKLFWHTFIKYNSLGSCFEFFLNNFKFCNNHF